MERLNMSDFLYINSPEKLENAINYYFEHEDEIPEDSPFLQVLLSHHLLTWDIVKKIILSRQYQRTEIFFGSKYSRQIWDLVKNDPEGHIRVISILFYDSETEVSVVEEIKDYDWESLDTQKLKKWGNYFDRPHNLDNPETVLWTYVAHQQIVPPKLPTSLWVVNPQYLQAIVSNKNIEPEEIVRVYDYVTLSQEDGTINLRNIQAKIAANPSTPPEILEKMCETISAAEKAGMKQPPLKSRDRGFRYFASALSRNPSLDLELLERIVSDSFLGVNQFRQSRNLRILANRKDLSEEKIRELYNANKETAHQLAVHPNLPYDLMQEIFENTSKHQLLAQNPSLSVDIAEQMLAKNDTNICARIVYYNESLSPETKLYAALRLIEKEKDNYDMLGLVSVALKICPEPAKFLAEKGELTLNELQDIPASVLWQMVSSITTPPLRKEQHDQHKR